MPPVSDDNPVFRRCSVCMECIPGMKFASGCECGTVHADCLLRSLVYAQHEDDHHASCPVCKTGSFAESDRELVAAAQDNHDRRTIEDGAGEVDHEDVTMDCYIKYFKNRCDEATTAMRVATEKVARAIDILSRLAQAPDCGNDTKSWIRARITELESGW